VVAREFVFNQRLKQAGSDMIDWAKSISPIGGFTVPGKPPIVATGIPAKDLATTKDLVETALSLKSEQMHKISQKRDQVESQVRALNDEILCLQKRLSELAELDSLAIQLGNTTESFLNHVQTMNLNAEDISDIVGTEIADRGSLLHNMLMEWQEGVADRGSRKFIRGLSETTGRTKDSNLLDEQIITIATVAGEISDLAIHASILAHKIAEVSSFSARIAGLWRGIALKTNADKICHSLTPVIESAQEVIAENKKNRNIQFQNLLTEAETRNIPEIPISLWQSALFQIYASVAELSTGKPVRIVTRIRKDDAKTMLVVQVVATDDHVLPQRTQRQTYLLEVAKSVLTPFAVSVAALPALEGPFPIALTWQTFDKRVPDLPDRKNEYLETSI
jgi:transcriptional regulator of heat shock response